LEPRGNEHFKEQGTLSEQGEKGGREGKGKEKAKEGIFVEMGSAGSSYSLPGLGSFGGLNGGPAGGEVRDRHVSLQGLLIK